MSVSQCRIGLVIFISDAILLNCDKEGQMENVFLQIRNKFSFL